jgi:hypothetical protein
LIIDVELIKNNAKLGAQISVSLCKKMAEENRGSLEKLKATKITIIGGAAVDIISQSDSLKYDSG